MGISPLEFAWGMPLDTLSVFFADQHGVIPSFVEEKKIINYTENPRLVRLVDHLLTISDLVCISWRSTSHNQILFLCTYRCCNTHHSSLHLRRSHSHLCYHKEMPAGGTSYDFCMEKKPFGRQHQLKCLPSDRILRKYGKTFPL